MTANFKTIARVKRTDIGEIKHGIPWWVEEGIAIGHLQGVRRIALYHFASNPFVQCITPLAYFVSEETAETAKGMLWDKGLNVEDPLVAHERKQRKKKVRIKPIEFTLTLPQNMDVLDVPIRNHADHYS